jgi:hypothetical protein
MDAAVSGSEIEAGAVLTGGASGEGGSWASAGAIARRPKNNGTTRHRSLILALTDRIWTPKTAYLKSFPNDQQPAWLWRV